MTDITPFLNGSTASLIFKGILLLLIALYIIFVFMVFTHVRSLNRILIVQKTQGSPVLQSIAFVYLIVSISLFLLALVIL